MPVRPVSRRFGCSKTLACDRFRVYTIAIFVSYTFWYFEINRCSTKAGIRNTLPFHTTYISPTYRYISDLKILVIFNLYHNSKGRSQTHGFALFIFPKPHFSGLWFDIRFKVAIGCRYPFHICKIAQMHVFSIYHNLK